MMYLTQSFDCTHFHLVYISTLEQPICFLHAQLIHLKFVTHIPSYDIECKYKEFGGLVQKI